MYSWDYILLIGIVCGVWVIAGRYEWQIPPSLVRIISNLRPTEEEVAIPALLSLKIEAMELKHEDIEKEIYILRKSRRGSVGEIVMNVEIDVSQEDFVAEDQEKTKLRLESRFSGLTVNYTKKKPIEVKLAEIE